MTSAERLRTISGYDSIVVGNWSNPTFLLPCNHCAIKRTHIWKFVNPPFGDKGAIGTELLSKFGAISFLENVSKGITSTHLVFCDNLVFKPRRVKVAANFISLGSIIEKRLRRRQYSPAIIERTIGIVLGPCTDFYLIVWGFDGTFATGAACQQRTLTPPDTWSCPTLGLACVLMSRPISPELVLFPDCWVSNIPRYFCLACPEALNSD